METKTKCSCGESLLADIDQDTVTTVEGHNLVFRRNTDFILCFRCLSLFTISGFRDEGPEGAQLSHLTALPGGAS